jgi:hypothetical protein
MITLEPGIVSSASEVYEQADRLNDLIEEAWAQGLYVSVGYQSCIVASRENDPPRVLVEVRSRGDE